jgi:hypothetical protein
LERQLNVGNCRPPGGLYHLQHTLLHEACAGKNEIARSHETMGAAYAYMLSQPPVARKSIETNVIDT